MISPSDILHGKVLIVDDPQANALLIKRMLLDAGYVSITSTKDPAVATDQRIHAHVLICLIAYFVEAVITRRLREAKAGFTANEMFRALNEVYAVPVTVRGSRAWVRNELAGVAAEGYEVLRIRPPDRVMKVEKIQRTRFFNCQTRD